MQNKLMAAVGLLVLIGIGGFLVYAKMNPATNDSDLPLDGTPYSTTLTGTYECLPHLDTSGPQTMECAFGLVTDDGVHYAVNFGASEDAMMQFQSGARVTVEGNVVIREALSSDHWQKYNMKGIFTITKILNTSTPTSGAKINIEAVCQGALAYMTFPSSEEADLFVRECIAGNHPEVIERYKTDNNLDGATI